MEAKINFLRKTFIEKLKELDPATPPVWGLMNVQQMIEHMSDSFRIANGKDPHVIVTPAERLEPMKNFLLSEKEFKPNTKNILMSETPPNIRRANKMEAINELEGEINDFVSYFEQHPGSTTTNPFFGELNFEEWIQLLHKHAVHHLKQFNCL
ncbi:MAG: DUF1569 domain-containing protein [Bacteroidetes bacterium]|nr:DUF1569 domain-containing protein [Bacteroidota bacterium]